MNAGNSQEVKSWVQIRLATADRPFEGIDSTDSYLEAKIFAKMLTDGKEERYNLSSVNSGDEIQIRGKRYKVDSIEVLIGDYPGTQGVGFHTLISVTEV